MLNARAEAHRVRAAWRKYNDCWVILFRDVDTGIHFTLCNARRFRATGRIETKVQSFRGREAADRATNLPVFREHWIGYQPQVVRYEALKEFGDHHRRQHWRFDTLVLFVGTEAEIDFVARLTMHGGRAFDPGRGLFIAPEVLSEVVARG